MIPTHGNEHENLLEQVTCGDLQRDDPQLLAALDECPECRDRLAGLESVAGVLAAAVTDRRETLAGLDFAHEAPGSDLVAPFLRRKIAERRRQVEATQRRMPWLPLAAAAAVVATGGAWVLSEGAGDPPAEQSFLGHSFRFAGPLDAFEATSEITWEVELPLGGTYEVELLGPTGTALAPDREPRRLTQAAWTPTPLELEILPPDEFRLRVTVLDTFKQVQAEDSVWVRRLR